MIIIDKLCYKSGLRYENAGEKFAFAVITLLICVMSRSAAAAGIVMMVTGTLTVWKGGVPVLRYIRFLMAPLTFLLLSTIALVIHISETPLDLWSVSVGRRYLTVGSASLLYAGRLILTALSAVSCLYFLAFSTPVPDILEVLRRLHCPQLLLELMLLIYRFIFILLHTASSLLTAQRCRLGNRDFRTALKAFGAMGAALMVQAVRRSAQLYSAMEARCYDGTIRVLSEDVPPKRRNICAIVFFDGALLLFALWRRFWV